MAKDLNPLPPDSAFGRARKRLSKVAEETQFSKRKEHWYPFCTGVAAMLLLWRCPTGDGAYDTLMEDVIPTSVSVAAILAGFQGTIHTIMLSLRDGRVIRSLKEHGHYDRLISYVNAGVVSLLSFVVVSLIALSFKAVSLRPLDLVPEWLSGPVAQLLSKIGFVPSGSAAMTAFLAGLLIYSLLASHRIVRIIVRILRLDRKEGPTSTNTESDS